MIKSICSSVVIYTILICLGCSNNSIEKTTQFSFTLGNATDLLDKYTTALSTGDTTKIRPYWSNESVARDGFWLLHAWIGNRKASSDWPAFLEKFKYEIEGVRAEKNYHIIDLKWIEKSTANPQQHRMRFYVTHENKKWVLINPIDILTRDWQNHQTQYINYFYPPEIDIRDFQFDLERMDREVAKLVEIFDFELDQRIQFYRARSPAECGELLLHPPAEGYASYIYPPDPAAITGFKVVVSTSFYHPHEVVHLLQGLAKIIAVNATIIEGFGVAFGGTPATTPEFTLLEARNLLEEQKLYPLNDLILLNNSEFIRNNFITYFQSGAFVRFLYEKFGMDKLKEVCNSSRNSQQFLENLKVVLGFSIDELEYQLQSYLMNLKLTEVGYSIPPNAELTFSMNDPSEDDIGDGDYTYPRSKKFENGAFDLRKFEVLKDSNSVYFRIEFTNLIETVSYGSSDEKFVPGVVIAINKGDGKNHRQKRCHGIRFKDDEGFDLKLSIGSEISVSNHFGQTFFSTSDIYQNISDQNANHIEFSLPIELIGIPNSNWKFFVGVGLMSNRSMNFLYGGPNPVYKDHPVFISGGNFGYGNPAFIDILWPNKKEQTEMLDKYDPGKGLQPVIPMLGIEVIN